MIIRPIAIMFSFVAFVNLSLFCGGSAIRQEMNTDKPTRRKFFQRLIYSLVSTIAAGLSLPAFGYLFIPSRRRRDVSWAEAGTVTDLLENKPQQLVLQRKRIDGWKTVTERSTTWVVKTDQDVVAFAPQCTHLGCGYRWDEEGEQFLCPCHNSAFSIDGEVVSGPAPRGLDRYQVQVKGDRLWLGAIMDNLEES